MDFRIVLHDRNGTPRGELHRVRKATWSWVLNGEGAAEIVISTSDPRVTVDLMTRAPLIVIYSDAGNWGGVLKREVHQNGPELALRAWSNERLLRSRITQKTRSLDGYTNGAIAEALLLEANATWPTGIEVGYIYMGGTAHYYEIHYDDLLKRFQEMAATDDHDFEVTWDRKLNWYERKGSDKPNVVLAEGRNVVRWPRYSYSEDEIVNCQVCIGAGATWGQKLIATAQDSNSQNTYGFWQRADDYGHISEQTTLDLRAATLLANRKEPQRVLDLTIVDRPGGLWKNFAEGDRVRVILPSYHFGAGVDEMVRVLAREVDVWRQTMRLVVEVDGR